MWFKLNAHVQGCACRLCVTIWMLVASCWLGVGSELPSHIFNEIWTFCPSHDTKAAARRNLNCIKNKKIWRKTILNMVNGILTPCNLARSRHWFRQVTAPCNVACGSGIVTVNSPCYVIRDSGMTCHSIRPNVRHIWILHLVSITTHHCSQHVIMHQSDPQTYK